MGAPIYGFRGGQVLRFTYNSPEEMTNPTDRFKEVLVLHPRWMGKVHGLDLKRLTAAQREVLDAIMRPESKGKQHRLPLVNDILRRMDPIEDVKNPVSFYSKFVNPFLRTAGDCYRTYWPKRMLNVTIVKNTSITGNVVNPRPLFYKVEPKGPTKPEATKPSTTVKPTQSRLAQIKQRAAGQTKAGPAAPSKPLSRMELIKQRAAQSRKK